MNKQSIETSAKVTIGREKNNVDKSIREWANTYYLGQQDRFAHVKDLVEDHYPGGEVLEIGSVPCQLHYLLQNAGFRVVGLDIDPSRVSELTENLDLDVRQCDITQDRFPVEDDSVGVAIFSEVLEHIHRPTTVFKEIRRVLDPDGGKVIITTPNFARLETRIRVLSGKGPDNAVRQWEKLEKMGHAGHIRMYTPKELEGMLDLCGLEIVESYRTAFGGSKRPVTGSALNALYKVWPAMRPYQVAIAKISE